MKQKRGVALITALALIVVLGAVAGEVTGSARSASDTADNVRSRAVARYAAESGIVLITARIEDSLARLRDSAATKSYLNRIEAEDTNPAILQLGDARMQIAVVDINSRLDINSATAEQLMTFFSSLGNIDESRMAAIAIRNRVENNLARLPATGGHASPVFANPLRSLEELRRVPGVSAKLAEVAAPYLTVDGDGRINSVTASARVRAAAGGDLRDMPSRLLVISRGWRDGRPLTFEIQSVYALEYGKLTLVKWREREL